MKAERIALMPYWPARMDATMAALFLGIGVTKFLADVEAGTKPQPVWDGERKLWSLRQLERFVDAQYGLGASGDSWGDL